MDIPWSWTRIIYILNYYIIANRKQSWLYISMGSFITLITRVDYWHGSSNQCQLKRSEMRWASITTSNNQTRSMEGCMNCICWRRSVRACDGRLPWTGRGGPYSYLSWQFCYFRRYSWIDETLKNRFLTNILAGTGEEADEELISILLEDNDVCISQ